MGACARGEPRGARFLCQMKHPCMDGLPGNHNATIIVECGHGPVNRLCACGHSARLSHNIMHGRIPPLLVCQRIVAELVVDRLKGVELLRKQVSTVG